MTEHDATELMVEIKESMIASKYVSRSLFVGCTDNEIAEIERHAGGSLPVSFKAFLKVMGKQGNSFTAATRYTWKFLKVYRDWANEVIRENNSSYQIPKNAFVFACLDGWFYFFMLDEGNDPPVYSFGEGEQEPSLDFQTFTTMLRGIAQYILDAQKRIKHEDS